MQKVVGVNFLHTHPRMERVAGVDLEHVVVDKKDWEEIRDFFSKRPELSKELGEIEKSKCTIYAD